MHNMVRPRKKRMVGIKHNNRCFVPENIQQEHDAVIVTIDELEAMRLNYLESMSQTEAAFRMHVHQSTFHRALRRALEKVTDALVHGKTIKIEGGDYRMPGGNGTGSMGQGPVAGRGQGRGRGGRGGMGPAGFAGPQGNCRCPACGHEQPHQAGVPCSQMQCSQCGAMMLRV